MYPFLYAGVQDAGVSDIQFGMMMVLNLMIETMTPPIGVLLFVVSNVAKISSERVTKATLPFLMPILIVLLAACFVYLRVNRNEPSSDFQPRVAFQN